MRNEYDFLKGKKNPYVGNTIRKNVLPGTHVMVVKKEDQRTGKLTEGIVKDILTNSAVHPRGIKVRLEDGTVGRVQEICEG